MTAAAQTVSFGQGVSANVVTPPSTSPLSSIVNWAGFQANVSNSVG
jgi:hypothetical protein